jgi:putative salt-induced outer membrane protein YdiY
MRMQFVAALSLLFVTSATFADEIIFKNGDRLTGTITQADGGKLKIKSKVAGDVTVEMKDVQTFTTDQPMQVRLKDNRIIRDQFTGSPGASPPVAPATQPAEVVLGQTPLPLTDIKRINAKQAWTGSILGNGMVARGNTHSMNLGLAADATLRRDDEFHDDRFTLTAAYNYGKQRVAGVNATSIDNWFAQAKYDKFFTDQFYGYGVFRYDHDRLAFLNYRLSPGVGVGYQWVESADFNFSTEAGVSYVYEDYSTDGTQDRVALRLAYHLDKKLSESVSLFHNLEWLPSFDDPSDYNLNTDAGVRAKLTTNMFSEFKVQYSRDSTPAPGADKNDVRFLLSIGWTF